MSNREYFPVDQRVDYLRELLDIMTSTHTLSSMAETNNRKLELFENLGLAALAAYADKHGFTEKVDLKDVENDNLDG